MQEAVRRYIKVAGYVQGVGFRYFTQMNANRLGLTGWVRNLDDGGVELEIQGPWESVDTMIGAVAQGPRYAQVEHIEVHPLPTEARERNFEVHDAWM